MLKVSFSSLEHIESHTLVLTVAGDNHWGSEGAKLNKKLDGALAKAIAGSSFTGAKEQTLLMSAPPQSEYQQVLLLGLGDPAKIDKITLQQLGGVALAALPLKETKALFFLDQHPHFKLALGEAAAALAFGALLRSYRFDKYRTKLKPELKPKLQQIIVASLAKKEAQKEFSALEKIAAGVFMTRDLVSEPANVIYPESLADACKSLKSLGIKVDVLDEKQIKKLGMGALYGVGQGSAQPPRLVTMTWQGDPKAKDKRPLVYVGKGVTFDTGGISLKPPSGMEDMKWDMAGAGAVIGALKAIAGRKAKVNVVGVVGLVENMPGGKAQRPGDVVTTMSGQTVEVINTDAEGRLVLADAVWYAQEQFNPRFIVDLATLTGAVIVALGREYAGIFSNDDKLCDQLLKASAATDEKLWRLPLSDAYDKHIESPIADMKNTGAAGEAGSAAGAQFIQRFVKKGMAWAHLDIAGMAWQNKDKPICPKGATAFGVRLLDHLADL